MTIALGRWRVGAAVLFALTAGPARAQAQQHATQHTKTPATSAAVAAPGPGGPGDRRTPDQLRTEVIERMRALRAWRIVETLKLDQAASARLFPVLARYDDREMALANERRDLMRELRGEVEAAHPDDGRITAAINRLAANRTRRHALDDERIKELRKVLTPLQQGKLVLLLPTIAREFTQRIREVSEDDSPSPPHPSQP